MPEPRKKTTQEEDNERIELAMGDSIAHLLRQDEAENPFLQPVVEKSLASVTYQEDPTRRGVREMLQTNIRETATVLGKLTEIFKSIVGGHRSQEETAAWCATTQGVTLTSRIYKLQGALVVLEGLLKDVENYWEKNP